MSLVHQEQVPRKQGLKPGVSKMFTVADLASRASSTKTRIETSICQIEEATITTSRASSTKTSIETCQTFPFWIIWSVIKSKFHENKDWNLSFWDVFFSPNSSRASSTKTRIETCLSETSSSVQTHQEQVPRKQGLKRRIIAGSRLFQKASRASSTKTRIETSDLRVFLPSISQPSRASSTKTRIETTQRTPSILLEWTSRASSTKTRIET